MTVVLDSGALSSLAARRTALQELVGRGLWPAEVPTAALAESLTGDHRRDFHVNRLLKLCQVRDVDELQARDAARMRTATGRAGTISAVDAVVVAQAATRRSPVVVTSDPNDMNDLAAQALRPVAVVAV
jgi:predicted nucleic acid-binding protein